MDHIVLEVDILRVLHDDTYTEAGRNSRIGNFLDSLHSIVELNASEFGVFLRTIINGDIVKLDLSSSVCEVGWLEEVCHKNLTAPWAWVSSCH